MRRIRRPGGHVILPNNWRERSYQFDLWYALTEERKRRLIQVAHRRWGKDDVALNSVAVLSQQHIGDYWYLLPNIEQARKVIWASTTRGENRIERAFPPAMRIKTREDSMFIKFANGSTVQFAGSDNFDSLRGGNPAGIVFSEFAMADPECWAILRPIVAENKGWALFISTPRGRNHLWNLLQTAKSEPDWFWSVQSVNDTDVFDNETLGAELRQIRKDYGEVQGNALFSQEYECSFDAPILGAFYADELRHAEAEGRICPLKIERDLPVYTGWDLGRTDSTAIWFIQYVRPHYHLIYYHESSGAALHYYVDKLHELKKQFGWKYAAHYFPHDVKNHELISDLSRIDTLQNLGVDVTVVQQHHLLDGINATRRLLDQAKIDPVRCERGLDCLKNYRREWKVKTRNWSEGEVKDWTNHGCDALRTYAAGHDPSHPGKRDDSYSRRFDRPVKSTSWAA